MNVISDECGLKCMGGGTCFKVGGTSARQKIMENLSFELAPVTSQAFKYDVITYTPYKGLNYTILDKTLF